MQTALQYDADCKIGVHFYRSDVPFRAFSFLFQDFFMTKIAALI